MKYDAQSFVSPVRRGCIPVTASAAAKTCVFRFRSRESIGGRDRDGACAPLHVKDHRPLDRKQAIGRGEISSPQCLLKIPCSGFLFQLQLCFHDSLWKSPVLCNSADWLLSGENWGHSERCAKPNNSLIEPCVAAKVKPPVDPREMPVNYVASLCDNLVTGLMCGTLTCALSILFRSPEATVAQSANQVCSGNRVRFGPLNRVLVT